MREQITMIDILLITVDALRADHIGCLGYNRDTTPRLDNRVSDWVIYENATAHGPTTFTSFPSILTGSHAYENPGFPVLANESIAEYLREAGYHTLTITSNVWISPTYGYGSGFDDIHALGRGPRAATGWWERTRHRIGDVLGAGIAYRLLKGAYDYTRAIDEMTEEDVIFDVASEHMMRKEPTFTWVHYMTTHAPYIVDPDNDVPFVDEVPDEDSHRDLIERARHHPEDVVEDDRLLLRDLYDASIRHVDRRIDEFLSTADLDGTLVCITADHGEGFWEHDYYEHPPELHQELLHVPLFVRSPEEKSARVAKPVGLNRIPATITAHADIEADGAALPPWGEDDNPICSAVAHSSRFEPDNSSREHLKVAVRDGRWKLVRAVDETSMLYNLSSNSNEYEDVSDENEAIVDQLESCADAFADRLQFGEPSEIPVHLEDRLSDLGYLE